MKIPLFVNTTNPNTVKSPTVVLGTGRWDIERSHSDVELYIYVDGSQHTDPTITVGDTPSLVYAEALNTREYFLWASLQIS
jgi:hypothetical protein